LTQKANKTTPVKKSLLILKQLIGLDINQLYYLVLLINN